MVLFERVQLRILLFVIDININTIYYMFGLFVLDHLCMGAVIQVFGNT